MENSHGNVSCSACAIVFDNVAAFRLHAKSDEHVTRIKRRAAQSGVVLGEIGSPASDSGSSDDDNQDEDAVAAASSLDSEASSDEEKVASSTCFDSAATQCLFCSSTATDVEANLAHMATAHSFFIAPYPSLTVEPTTLLRSLGIIVYERRTCIACGRRRRSPIAVQQHMRSKGHCRFDMASPKVAELCRDEAPAVPTTMSADDGTLRLASGRVVLQRGCATQHRGRGTRHARTGNGGGEREVVADAGEDDTASPDDENSVSASAADNNDDAAAAVGGANRRTALDRNHERRFAAATRSMAQLSVRDQQALAHLPRHEQRRQLALREKQTDRGRRAEWRARAALGRKGNKTLMKHYKSQGPERPLG